MQDYAANPRKIDKTRFAELVKSIKQDGYHMRLLVNLDGVIIGGHARKKALLKAGYTQEDEVEVLVPDRLLEGDDFDRLNIRDNLQYGDFDFDMLGNLFDAEKLIDWGMPPGMLGKSHYSLNEDEPDKTKEKKVKTCPACGELL